MHNFQAMSESFLEVGAGWCVSDGEELIEKVSMLLGNRGLLESMGVRAKHFVQENQGALDRVMERLASILEKRETTGASQG
jgi:3-deoxy-D-manno-octulosonic-acid transferase